jgi:hypothetical protein
MENYDPEFVKSAKRKEILLQADLILVQVLHVNRLQLL